MNKGFFRKIHLWLSVPFGLIITVVCLSGAVLVFEDEITSSFREHQRRVDPAKGEGPLSEEDLTAKLQDAFRQPVEVARVVKDEDPAKAYLFIITSPRRGAVLIDQYTGEIKDRGGKLPFFEVMLGLHRCLLIPDSPNGINPGRIAVGVSVLAFVLSMLSGACIWVPVRISQWRLRADLFRMHALVGIYASVFLLIMAATGLTWTFGWWHDMIYAIPGTGRGMVTALHLGTYAGMSGKIIAFTAALTGASLPVTGYWLLWRRCRNKKRLQQRNIGKRTVHTRG